MSKAAMITDWMYAAIMKIPAHLLQVQMTQAMQRTRALPAVARQRPCLPLPRQLTAQRRV